MSFGGAHSYMAHVREHPPPGRAYKYDIVLSLTGGRYRGHASLRSDLKRINLLIGTVSITKVN